MSNRGREAVIDRLLAVFGGLLGGALTAAFLTHRFLTRAKLGDPTALTRKSDSPDGGRNEDHGRRLR